MEKELPRRKQLRYDGINYDAPGAYFITFCTHNRKGVLSRVVGANHDSPETELTAYGEIVERVIHEIPSHLNVAVNEYVIMPNHVHLIVVIGEHNAATLSTALDAGEDSKRAIRESPLRNRSLLSKAVGYIKMNATRDIRARYGNITVWQRGYYDHVIRNRKDYDEHVRYVGENPMMWHSDPLYEA